MILQAATAPYRCKQQQHQQQYLEKALQSLIMSSSQIQEQRKSIPVLAFALVQDAVLCLCTESQADQQTDKCLGQMPAWSQAHT